MILYGSNQLLADQWLYGGGVSFFRDRRTEIKARGLRDDSPHPQQGKSSSMAVWKRRIFLRGQENWE